ncbi:hypothetical protein ACKKBF_B35670 [Auxenochlorella protothecoides x Auxenochlorella symbiontica]
MTIPTSIIVIQLAAWVQTTTFLIVWLRKARKAPPPDVTASASVSRRTLLVYRLACLGYALFIGIRQYLDRGSIAFVYYTVWNWWLLTAYFALAALASWLAISRKGWSSAKPRTLHWVLVAIFHTEASAIVVVDTITWLVLVPMLMADPDPARRAMWASRLFCLESYSQHGINALMMAGEIALGCLPPDLWAAGGQGAWAGVYGVWAAVFFLRHGRPIYPFMDVKRPHAWVGFLAMFLLAWAGFGLVQGGLALRMRAERRSVALAARKVTSQNEPLLGKNAHPGPDGGIVGGRATPPSDQ